MMIVELRSLCGTTPRPRNTYRLMFCIFLFFCFQVFSVQQPPGQGICRCSAHSCGKSCVHVVPDHRTQPCPPARQVGPRPRGLRRTPGGGNSNTFSDLAVIIIIIKLCVSFDVGQDMSPAFMLVVEVSHQLSC